MQLQSKNLNKVRAFTLCYLEILLQGVFRIWFCIPALGLAGKYLCSGRFDSIGNQLTVDSYTMGVLQISFWLHHKIRFGCSPNFFCRTPCVNLLTAFLTYFLPFGVSCDLGEWKFSCHFTIPLLYNRP